MKSEKNKKTPAYGKLKNFMINPDLDQALSRAAEHQNCSVSALIRRFCHKGLESIDLNSKNTNR